MKILFTILFVGISLFTTKAQQTNCGVTSELWQKEMVAHKSFLETAVNLRTTSTTGIRYIPLTIHIVRGTDGYGGPSYDAMSLFYTSLMNTNRALQDIGIQFYIDGNIDIIRNNAYTRPLRGSADHMALLAIKNPNTANVWINGGWNNSNAVGYGGTYGVELSTDLSFLTVVHQFGHFLTLAHTYETA